jgi:hypothetical protein
MSEEHRSVDLAAGSGDAADGGSAVVQRRVPRTGAVVPRRAGHRRPPRAFAVTGTLKLLCAVVTAVSTVLALNWSANREWQAFKDELQARGEPLTFAEIEAQRPDIPDELNSALVMAPLREDLAQLMFEDRHQVLYVGSHESEPVDWRDGTPRFLIPPSRAFRDRHVDLLAGLEKLRGKPTGRLDISDVDDPHGTLLLDLSGYRFATKLLHLDTRLKLIDGDVAAAADNLELAINVAGALDTHPTVTGQLVQIAAQAVSGSAVECILGTGEVDAATLKLWQERFSSMAAQDDQFRGALLGERAAFVQILEMLANGEMPVKQGGNGIVSFQGSGTFGLLPEFFFRKNQLRGAKLLTQVLEASDEPLRQIELAMQVESKTEELSRFYFLVKTFAADVLGRACELRLLLNSYLECTAVGLAAERYRLDEGSFPESLDDLVPKYLAAVPIDPFDGQPLKYIRIEGGVEVYTIAADREDNGGCRFRSKMKEKTGRRVRDEGIRLYYPEARGYPLTDEPDPEAPEQDSAEDQTEGG